MTYLIFFNKDRINQSPHPWVIYCVETREKSFASEIESDAESIATSTKIPGCAKYVVQYKNCAMTRDGDRVIFRRV